jgi:hypothetical protein
MKLRKSFQLQVEQLESRDAPAVLWSMNIGKGKSPVSLQVLDTGLYQIGSGKNRRPTRRRAHRQRPAFRGPFACVAAMLYHD